MLRSTLAAICATLLASSGAFADSGAGDEASKAARKRFDEGTAAYDAGRYEAARIAFQQAYAIKPHPAVLRNLGEAELRTEHFVEAATHLAAFLKSGNAPESRERVRQSLAAAEAKIARLYVDVSVPGAEISVDNEPTGLSPLEEGSKFVASGEHVLQVKKAGFNEVTQPFAAEAGRAVRIFVALHEVEAGEAVPAAASPAAQSVAPLLEASPVATPESVAHAASPARSIVIAAGATSSALALGFGTVMILRARAEKSSYDELRAPYLDSACNAQNAGTGAPCSEIHATNDRFRRDRALGVYGFIAGGVLAAGTVATLIFWHPPESEKKSAAVSPWVGSGVAGFSVLGQF